MTDNTKIKLIGGALLALLAISTAGWLVTTVRVERAERRLTNAVAASAKAESEAAAHKLEAAEYIQQIASLESQLAEIRSTTAKQDEKLKNTTTVSSHVSPTLLGCQCFKDRGQALNRLFFAADHEAISDCQSPDAAARADVHVMDALVLQLGGAPRVVVESGIAAVDDGVAWLQQCTDGLNGVFSRGS